MSMFDNISDDKVEFYCDNRLAAVEDLDFVLTELKEIVKGVRVITTDAESAFKRMEELIDRFDETLENDETKFFDSDDKPDIGDACSECGQEWTGTL